MRFQLFGYAFALAATLSNALNIQQWCGNRGICFEVNVPSDGKDIFFQITGPSSMSWISLGQGTSMTDSNILVVYSDTAGTNVTLSSRLGTGHMPPPTSTSVQAILLDGSKVTGDKMVANVKCSNCESWNGGTMNFTAAATNWIYAYKSGPAIKSDSVSAPIEIHEGYGVFQFNLASATGGDGTVNPFSNSSGNATVNIDNSGSSSGDSLVLTDSTKAHGLMGALTFILVFPTGSIIIRILPFKNVLWFHVGLQMLGYLATLAVLETGIYIAVKDEEFLYTHPILGLIIIGGLLIQPFLGLGHHVLFKRRGGPNVLTMPHIWWGRVLITLGIINGGLGLQLMQESIVLSIAYGICASVVWSTWMGLNLLSYMRNRNRPETPVKMKSIRKTDNDDNRAGTSHSSKI